MERESCLSDRSGWWIRFSLFLSCSLFIYAYAAYRLHLEEEPLLDKAYDLEVKKDHIIRELTLLREMTKSLSDPSADEYALIVRYGKIPEGMKKIVFSSDDPDTSEKLKQGN